MHDCGHKQQTTLNGSRIHVVIYFVSIAFRAFVFLNIGMLFEWYFAIICVLHSVYELQYLLKGVS